MKIVLPYPRYLQRHRTPLWVWEYDPPIDAKALLSELTRELIRDEITRAMQMPAIDEMTYSDKRKWGVA